ncbi:MAG TPA: CPBP family intramembrane glutamic endopeptidase [Gammaproteobacteria bacterium]|nr:CPBP family intramembrane glutamic endopeptidase [Gammaproteobacteria bacterium]
MYEFGALITLRNIFLDSFRKSNKEVIVIFFVAVFAIIGDEYISSAYRLYQTLKQLNFESSAFAFSQTLNGFKHLYGNLAPLIWWSSMGLIIRLIIPMLLMKLMFHRNLENYGIKFKQQSQYIGLYILLYLCMIPLIFLVSKTPAFQHTYPMFKAPQSLSGNNWIVGMIIWELVYLLRFVSLEFFFRGFLVLGLKKTFGIYSVFIALIPYVMIHFNKPFLEMLGSIVAGIVLGVMSYFTHSVMMGIALHFMVALTMDITALIMSVSA